MSYYARYYKNEDCDHYSITKNDLYILDFLAISFYNIKSIFNLLPKLVITTGYEIQGSRWFIYRQMNFSWLWFSIVYSYKFDEELIDYDS